MSAVTDGPWHCASTLCDKGPSCLAHIRNLREAEWIRYYEERYENPQPFDSWMRAIKMLPEPPFTIMAARQAIDFEF